MITTPSQHSFDTILGHEAVKLYLRNALAGDLLPHAVIFQGSSGLGKLSMAYALAKRMNCLRGDAGGREPCTCNNCRKISEGIFADVLMVEPQGSSGQITLAGWKPGKDDPDGLQYYRFVDSRPLEGRKKVLIIRQAERMNLFLANYLLKLIEEPPSYLLMILVTHRPSDLLATIRSRCTSVRFGPLSAEEMAAFAAQIPESKASASERSPLVRLAEGRPGVLMELLGQASESRRKALAQQMTFFQQYGFVALFRAASEILQIGKSGARSGASNMEGFEETLNLLQAWIRDVMIYKTLSQESAAQLLLNQDAREELRAYAQEASLEGLASTVDSLREAYGFVPRMADRNYVLETLLLKIGRAMRR